MESRMGEGHAHLYINDKKVSRLYGPWHHIGPLPSGQHEISADITSNQHGVYVYQGEPIQDAVVINVEE